MSDDQPRREPDRPGRRLHEVFGADPWSEPGEDDAAQAADERRREREYRENRPPHHEERLS